MTTFTIDKPSGFSLLAASDFYAGFTPGSGMAAAESARLTLAFCVDGSFSAALVSLREERDLLVAELVGDAPLAAVRRQLARMLGLEADGAAWRELGRRAPLVGKLQREFPGFFTAAKASPYDAAVWSIISPRISMKQAARIKLSIAANHGTALTLEGRTHTVFPAPAQLLEVEHVEGLSQEKLSRLHGVAHAALDGLLDAERLRSLGAHEALAQLQSIRGIGPWSASHVYFRGAAPVDGLPTAEPRVLHGLSAASGRAVPTAASFVKEAERWRPFRMWVCVLLSRHLARTDGWRAPGLRHERAGAGRALGHAR